MLRKVTTELYAILYAPPVDVSKLTFSESYCVSTTVCMRVRLFILHAHTATMLTAVNKRTVKDIQSARVCSR